MANSNKTRAMRPALTPEAREKQLIAAAYDLAEKKILDGTANSQIICHFLKMGSERAKLEAAKLESENVMLRSKAEAYDSAKSQEEMYANAIAAMRDYSGRGDDDDEDY